MAKRGAPMGNQNARKAGKAPKHGQSKGLRSHLGSRVNYQSKGFLAALKRQRKRGY